MENSNQQQHIKTLNVDGRSKNRIRFTSARQRSKLATADIYRSYKRRVGLVTSAATREEQIHHPGLSPNKKRKTTSVPTRASQRQDHVSPHLLKKEKKKEPEEKETENDSNEDVDQSHFASPTFADELDLTRDRNASQLFAQFYKNLYPLVRSLPEILHHLPIILTLLLSYVASLEVDPEVPSPEDTWKRNHSPLPLEKSDSNALTATNSINQTEKKHRFVPNLLTTDILHLLAVLARDIRHEIHPYLHTWILPRIIHDLINPPTTNTISSKAESNSHKAAKQITLNITIVESAFRTISYIFRYDADLILQVRSKNEDKEKDDRDPIHSHNKKNKNTMALDAMRQYYGVTLGHKLEYVRRLSAETFAPLIRKLPSLIWRKKHLKRVLQALTVAVVTTSRTNHPTMSSSSFATNGSAIKEETQKNAIDGISLLLFQICKGVNGRLHSKSDDIVQFILEYLVLDTMVSSEENKIDKVQLEQTATIKYKVASEFFKYLRNHLDMAINFLPIWKHLHRSLDLIAETITSSVLGIKQKVNSTMPSSQNIESILLGLEGILKIIYESILHGHGCVVRQVTTNQQRGQEFLSESCEDDIVEILVAMLERMLEPNFYHILELPIQRLISKVLSSSWKLFPNNATFSSRLLYLFPSIIKFKFHDQTNVSQSCDQLNVEEESSVMDPSFVLATDLLPYLPSDLGMKFLAPSLLSSAANLIRRQHSEHRNDINNSPLILFYTIATAGLRSDLTQRDSLWSQQHKGDDLDWGDGNNLFFTQNSSQCVISKEDKDIIIKYCLADITSDISQTDVTKNVSVITSVGNFDLDQEVNIKDSGKHTTFEKLCYYARFLPFLALIRTHADLTIDQNDEKLFCDIISCLAKVLAFVDFESKNRKSACYNKHRSITISLLLSGFVAMINECPSLPKVDQLKSSLRKVIALVRTSASNLLSSSPQSFLALSAVSDFVKILKSYSLQLDDKSDDIFDLLSPNLRSSNHFIRLLSLSILDSLPQRLFITNSSDLDLTGDLDDECDFVSLPNGDNTNEITRGSGEHNKLSGLCDIIKSLLHIEMLPPKVENERNLVSAINRVEILGRNGSLPAVYSEAAVNHMFGILHIKFQPLWPAAVKAISALTTAQEDIVWPSVETMLRDVMKPKSILLDNFENIPVPIGGQIDNLTSHFRGHYLLCEKLDFYHDSKEFCDRHDETGQMVRPLSTDRETLFENIWSVTEKIPLIIGRKSKIIVSIFFDFLQNQFYLFYDDDPDAREFNLNQQVDFSHAGWERNMLSRKVIHTRMRCFLRMFRELKGMKQLYKRDVLLVIFTSLLSNPDVSITQIALGCIAKYKLPYVTPYLESLQNMLDKGKLRETLVKFSIAREGGSVEGCHRNDLFPMLIRILFGRLLARGSPKSTKDGPAVRRAAIMSFLSTMGFRDDTSDFDYFVYLMIRAFIPKSVDMTIADQGHANKQYITEMIRTCKDVDPKMIGEIPHQRQEGFLNLLSTVIDQLGFGVCKYVEIFLSLCLSLVEYSEIYRKGASNVTDANLVVEIGDKSENCLLLNRTRVSVVRNSSFLCIKEIFERFTQLNCLESYKDRLWVALTPAIISLPSVVINAEKAPSVLKLLESCTIHRPLIHSLHNQDDLMTAVFMCISSSTRDNVMDSILVIIDNLLTEGGNDELRSTTNALVTVPFGGMQLVQKHLPLLIHQFLVRLDDSKIILSKQLHRPSSAIENELNILCRMSQLLFQVRDDSELDVETIEDLCKLMVPYLSLDSRSSDGAQSDVIGILAAVIPRISYRAAISHYHSFAKLLGPNRARPGITSVPRRQGIVTVIEAISRHYDDCSSVRKVVQLLKCLSASHKKNVNEYNYDEMIPVIANLSNQSGIGSWLALITEDEPNKSLQINLQLIWPLLYSCFHFLYDSDGVLNRGCLSALKTLIRLISGLSRDDTELLRFVETSIVPNILTGIRTENVNARRSFVQLLSECVKCFAFSGSKHLYSDLNSLIREDDPDLDFFLNIIHIQIHRRSRAFMRLRRLLDRNNDVLQEGHQPCTFSVLSLTNVFLPLAMQSIHELSSKEDEAFLLEAVAMIGAVARHLPWGKYRNTLRTVLLQITRRPEQERHMIATTCALIDAFHYKINFTTDGSIEYSNKGTEDENACDDVDKTNHDESIDWKILENTLITKIEGFLVKTKVNGGLRHTCLRCQLLLSLCRLFQKLPARIFEQKLPRVLGLLCDALKNKESDEREDARVALAKIAASINVKYLSQIIRELAVTLTEGYQLHVLAATLHSILLSLNDVKPPIFACNSELSLDLHFDKAVPAMMDIILSDVFGKASEMKEVHTVRKRLIKEAMGNKSYHSLQIISEKIIFRPFIDLKLSGQNGIHMSSVHAVVTPFLEKLRNPSIDNITLGKVQECLTRVVVGMSKNISITMEALIPFVHATISPLISVGADRANLSSSDDSDAEDDHDALIVSKTGKQRAINHMDKNDTKTSATKIFEWNPSALKAAKDSKEAYDMKVKAKMDLRIVQDGSNAPKLTGSTRNEVMVDSININNPAVAATVSFSLSLLHSVLKKSKLNGYEDMLDPFVEILTNCVVFSKDNNIILLSLKNLQCLMRWDLPSIPKNSKKLGSNTLNLLTLSGTTSTSDEISQMAFKTLALLIALDRRMIAHDLEGSGCVTSELSKASELMQVTAAGKTSSSLPLTKPQMQVLISMLRLSVTDSDHHNATFALIKAITSRHYISSEYYDLMEYILNLSVQSQKSSVRQQCSQIFMQYLIEYPMGHQRLEQHLKQAVLNLKYDYEEGRLSALSLLTVVIQKLPLPLLEEYTQLLFLPLVLQLVNDDSMACRGSVGTCLSWLLKRLSIQLLQSLYEYTIRWAGDPNNQNLRRTSAQLLGIFVENRPDFLKRGSTVEDLVAFIHQSLQNELSSVSCEINGGILLLGKEWELSYFYLQTLEKISTEISSAILTDSALWKLIIKCLIHPHPWIQQVASRMISSQLAVLNPREFAAQKKKGKSNNQKNRSHRNSSSQENTVSMFLLELSGSLFELARNLCYQINTEEEKQVEEVSRLAIKNLTWVVTAMYYYPHLCFRDGETNLPLQDGDTNVDGNVNDSETDSSEKEAMVMTDSNRPNHGKDEEEEEERQGEKDTKTSPRTEQKDPVGWLFTRLSNIAKKARGPKCREVVFKCFGAMAAACEPCVYSPHLRKILAPMYRVITQVSNREEYNTNQYHTRGPMNMSSMTQLSSSEAALPKEVMEFLESKCETSIYIEAYAHVQRMSRVKREHRKEQIQMEKVLNPEAAAKRKMQKHMHEKERKKRKVEGRKQSRGVFGKKKRYV